MTKSEHTQSVIRSASLVLAGAGHAHLVAMRHWMDSGWSPPPGSLLISSEANAWYSGMMPGLIAGRFTLDECAIALAPLCQQLGIGLVQADVVALDSHKQLLELSTGAVISYQHLSVNTGSRPLMPEHSDNSVLLVPAKPFPDFIAQWKSWQQSPPVSLMVLGGGAAAFELAMAINKRFRQTAVSVVCSGQLLGSLAPGVQRQARHCLMDADIKLIENCHIDTIAADSVWSEDNKVMSPDAVVLATGASAHPWYRSSGLSCDAAGFILVDERLCAVGAASVFVSGDAASANGSRRSGVFSVRHGPVIAHNIKAVFENAPLQSYQPQGNALALLATADGGALMSYGSLGLGGRFTAPLLGRWKDYLDLSFMKRHRL
ncbi:MAG: FAD-dependent oxidoreductase [Pseudohongiella sp.]|nr:FAD-dependent oxidoreductase [Pseudohongiella sp.]